MQTPPAVPKAAPPVPPQEPDSPALQESVLATPTSQQLATVAEAAKVLEAYGFALTEAQSVAVQAQKAAAEANATEVPQQWAGYRPGTVPPGSGDRAGAPSSSSWQRSERGQTTDDTGYGRASEHHPYHRQSQAKQRARGGWSKQSDSPQETKEEATKKRPGVPDRRERGAARGQETRYSIRSRPLEGQVPKPWLPGIGTKPAKPSEIRRGFSSSSCRTAASWLTTRERLVTDPLC
eukprot:2310807-Amphidinium_carterae.1